MSLDSAEVILAPYGHVYTGATTLTMPTDVTTAMTTVDADWQELGYLDEDGVEITPSIDTNDIKGWQSTAPLKTTITEAGLELKFNMLQINQTSTAVFFFGETWVNASGTGRLSITSNPDVDERAMVIEWKDDDAYWYRLVCERGLLTDRESMQLKRDEAVALGVTYMALDANGEMGYLLSNNPDLVPST